MKKEIKEKVHIHGIKGLVLSECERTLWLSGLMDYRATTWRKLIISYLKIWLPPDI